MNRLRTAAMTAFWFHLLAGTSMALVLRNGLETNPNFQDRLGFIVNHRTLWTFGWLAWTAAAIAILYFYSTFASAHRTGNLAVLLAAAAIAPDLSAQAIEIGVLPGVAERLASANIGMELFIFLDRIAVVMSGYLANGLYSLSALILAWTARRAYPPWVSTAGVAVGCFGLILSTAALIDSAPGMFWANVLLVPCLLIWLVAVSFSEIQS